MGITATYKVAGVGEADHIKAYYAALAGARYALYIMADPSNQKMLFTPTLPPPPPGYVQVSLHGEYVKYLNDANTGSPLFNDLGLRSPHDVVITVFRSQDSGDTCKVESTYS